MFGAKSIPVICVSEYLHVCIINEFELNMTTGSEYFSRSLRKSLAHSTLCRAMLILVLKE